MLLVQGPYFENHKPSVFLAHQRLGINKNGEGKGRAPGNIGFDRGAGLHFWGVQHNTLCLPYVSTVPQDRGKKDFPSNLQGGNPAPLLRPACAPSPSSSIWSELAEASSSAGCAPQAVTALKGMADSWGASRPLHKATAPVGGNKAGAARNVSFSRVKWMMGEGKDFSLLI